MRTFKRWRRRVIVAIVVVVIVLAGKIIYGVYKTTEAQVACQNADPVPMQDSDRYHILGSDKTEAIEKKGYSFDLRVDGAACGYTRNGVVTDSEFFIEIGKCNGVFQNIKSEHRFAIIRDPGGLNQGRVSELIEGLPTKDQLLAEDGFTDC